MSYKILIVDDSAVMRKKLSQRMNDFNELEITGTARNGIEMLEKCKRLKPDLIIMDIEMPEMNGFEALQILKETNFIPTILISHSQKHEFESLQTGAVHFYQKDYLLDVLNTETIHMNIISSIKEYAVILLERLKMEEEIFIPEEAFLEVEEQDLRLVVIGSSTGGPSALQLILEDVKQDFPVPIVIVQHIPVGFTAALAKRFDLICPLEVKEAEDGELLKKGYVYIAPAGVNTRITLRDNRYVFSLFEEVEVAHLYKPSIDSLLHSVAKTSKNALHTFILTGMGNDGLSGCTEVKQQGGSIYAQSEETCVVYGMPKVVTEALLTDETIELPEIANKLNSLYF